LPEGKRGDEALSKQTFFQIDFQKGFPMSSNEVIPHFKALNGKWYANKQDAVNYNALFKDLMKAIGKANPAALNNEAALKKHLVKAIQKVSASGATPAAKFEAVLKDVADALQKSPAADTADADVDGVQTVVRVNGVDINLDDVSPFLRRQYHDTSKKAARHAGAKNDLQSIGEQMLAEVFPKMALKAAMSRPLSNHAAIDDMIKRSR
jgi:hypothetical protein